MSPTAVVAIVAVTPLTTLIGVEKLKISVSLLATVVAVSEYKIVPEDVVALSKNVTVCVPAAAGFTENP
jgi:hypothetical protein